MKKILFISFISCGIHSSYAQQKAKVEKMPVQDNAAPSAAPSQAKPPAAPSFPVGIKAAILTPVAVQEMVVPPLATVATGPGTVVLLPVQPASATPGIVHP